LPSGAFGGADQPVPRFPAEMTTIHKISIAAGSAFQYEGKVTVPGRLLNEFSMGESGSRFSVATTSDSSPSGEPVNSVYSLGSNMTVVGRLEGIAPGEQIYSSRFMGDRLYLVTFQRTDPFFVIDLSHDQPAILGKLQLPGFSNYLQPYDANHIIGIGRDTVPSDIEPGFVRPQGIKVALFDVTDVSSPKAIDTYGFGDSQTSSDALNDHKALLFDKERNILSMPVSAYTGYSSGASGYWSGFYVFGLSPSEGIKLKGTIEHGNGNAGDSYYYQPQQGRSFFINDTLYTLSNSLMKMNDISHISHEINSIDLSSTGEAVHGLS